MAKDFKTTKGLTMRELCDLSQENDDRINEILNTAETEERELTAEEVNEMNTLQNHNLRLQARARAAATTQLRRKPDTIASVEKQIRENVARGAKTDIILMRDVMMIGDVNNGNLVPVNVQDVLKPLSEGTLYDKVGIQIPTGLVGDFVWPLYETVEATLAGEGVELSDTKIPFSKLTASPERAGVAIPATYQSLNQTQGLLERIIREVMPEAIRELIDKIILGRAKANESTNLKGPFVGVTAIDLDEVPTFRQLNADMKAAVLATGIKGENLCFVMTKAMEAILEGTPINEKGVFMPIVQDHKIAGVPVYTSNRMRDADGTEIIAIGDFRYQMAGFFNQQRFIIDPYSKARKDCCDFVLNTDFCTKTLRPEAFKLGKVKKVAASTPTTGGSTNKG